MAISDPIYQYVPGQMDWLLLNWMTRMEHDGELTYTLSAGVRTPLVFLNFMAARHLFFRLTELQNISYACWFEPCMGNTFMGFYTSPDIRDQHEEKVFFLFDMINLAFECGTQTICGLVQERDTPNVTSKFIKAHLRLGYTYAGMVPHFFDGKDCHVVAYTIEQWEGNQGGRWQNAWRRSRGITASTQSTRVSGNGVVAARE